MHTIIHNIQKKKKLKMISVGQIMLTEHEQFLK